MESFTMKLSDIQPTQLYISEVKLRKVQTFLKSANLRSIDPLPVKKIGDKTFFTDGHTRAYELFQQGFEEVEVYFDDDSLDWLQYLICVDWCLEADIREIGDLKERVVDHSTYRRLWYKRCDSMQKSVKQGTYEGVFVRIVDGHQEKSPICEEVLRALPSWFGIEQATQSYIRGVADSEFFALQIGSISAGFISLLDHNEFTSEIYCMGIYEELHGQGLGRKLVDSAMAFLQEQGKKFLTVKTLGDSCPDDAYERTRQFYRSIGFFPLEESLEIWGPDNPCLFMVKPLD